MKWTIHQLQNTAATLNGADEPQAKAKAALIQDALAIASFAQKKEIKLDFTAESFAQFQEAVVQYYVFLRRNQPEEAACRSLLKEKIGAYLTLMIANDFQEIGAKLILPAVTTENRMPISVMPGVQLDAYALAAEAVDREFESQQKYLSVRFQNLMDLLSELIDRIEATPDEDLNPVEPLF